MVQEISRLLSNLFLLATIVVSLYGCATAATIQSSIAFAAVAIIFSMAKINLENKGDRQ